MNATARLILAPAVAARRALCLGWLAAGASVFAPVVTAKTPAAPALAHRAVFGSHPPPRTLRELADWVAATGDNRQLPFAIVDKVQAQVFVFDARARVLGASPALLGSAIGDDSTPGIGDKPLAQILPGERTTPAGRFVAAMDRNLHGAEILWVDYDAAISLHPVVTSVHEERRAERLASVDTQDNRVSYGCINVPPGFFKNVVRAAFSRAGGIVYILPETRSAREVFGSSVSAPVRPDDQLPR